MRVAASLLLVLLFALPARAEKSAKELVDEFLVPKTRAAALAELGKRRDPMVIGPLVEALPDTDWLTQLYGALLFYRYRTDPATQGLRILTRARPPFLRCMAGYYLHLLGEKGADLVIADALTDPDTTPTIRYQMVVRAGSVNAPAVDAAIGSLLATETDANVLILCHAFAAPDRFERFARSVRRHLDHDDPAVRALAAALLVRFGYEEHGDRLAGEIRVAKIAAAHWPRLHAVLALTPRVPKPCLDALAERVGSGEETTVLRLQLDLLRMHPHPPAREAIASRLSHEDPEVATAAFDALLALPGAAAKEKLLPLLVAKSDVVKLRAADALRRLDDAAGLNVVIEVLQEGNAADREEAARVLGGFVRSAAVDPLIDALDDPEKPVRVEAAAQLTALLTRLFPYRRFLLKRAGYNPASAREWNAEAIPRIRTWWQQARARDW